jgi:hypothetical protein
VNHNANNIDSTCAETWFVATVAGTVEYGLEALKREIEKGTVRRRDLVWRQGMSDWLELDQVPLLRMLAASRVDETQAEPLAEPAELETMRPPAALAEPETIRPPAALDEEFDDETRVDDPSARLQASSSAPCPVELTKVLTESFDNGAQASVSKLETSAAPVALVSLESPTIIDETVSDEPPRFETLPAPMRFETSPAPKATIPVESTAIFDGLFRPKEPPFESTSGSLPAPLASNLIETTANIDDLLEDGDATFVLHKPALPESSRPPVASTTEEIRSEPAMFSMPENVPPPVAPTIEETRPEPAMFSIGEIALRAATAPPPAAPEVRIAKPTFTRPVTPLMSLPLSSIRPVSERPPSKAFSYKPPARPFAAKPSTRPLAAKSSIPTAGDTTMLPQGSDRSGSAQSLASLASQAPSKSRMSLAPPKPVPSAKPPPRSASALPSPSSMAARTVPSTPAAPVVPSPIIAIRSPERQLEVAAADRLQAHADLNRLAQSTQVPAPATPAPAVASLPTVIVKLDRVAQPIQVPAAATPAPAVASAPAASARLDGSVAPQPSDAPDQLLDSIYPSISSIQPAANNWNRSRRSMLFVAGALSVAAAIAIVVNLASPKHPRRSATATQMRMPSVQTPRLEESSAPAASLATQSPPTEAPTSELAQLPQAATVASNDNNNVKGSSLRSPPAAPERARTQQRTTRNENSVALQHEVEPKKASVDDARPRTASQRDKASSNGVESNTGKSAQASGQPTRGASDSVATWDQGTVERRAWMSPGF